LSSGFFERHRDSEGPSSSKISDLPSPLIQIANPQTVSGRLSSREH
jgi:hypothetical protein